MTRLSALVLAALALIGLAAAGAGPARKLARTVIGHGEQACTTAGLREPTVGDPNSLRNAIRCAPDGATIHLKPGQYGRIDIKGATGLRLTSADPAQPATLEQVRVMNGARIALDHLRFASDPTGLQYRLQIQGTTGATATDLDFPGVPWHFDEPLISSVFVRNSSKVALARLTVAWAWHGVSFLDVSELSITDSLFHDLRTDAIRGGGASNLLVARNRITTFHPVEKDHPDGIQLWSTQQVSRAHDIRILDNLITRGEGQIMQGIFVRDTFKKLPFERVEIAGNIVVGGMFNGIAVDGVEGGSIHDNQVLALPDQKSWIRVELGNDFRVENNFAQVFLLKPGVTARGNREGVPPASRVAAVVAAWNGPAASGRGR